jgi:hypothetical protein
MTALPLLVVVNPFARPGVPPARALRSDSSHARSCGIGTAGRTRGVGELSVQMRCLVFASNHVRVPGTKVVSNAVKKCGHSRRNGTDGLRASGLLVRADQLSR